MAVKLKGKDRLRAAMILMPKEARANVRAAMRSTGEDATALVRRLAPVAAHPSEEHRAGALRDSVEGKPADEARTLYNSRRRRASRTGTADPELAFVISAGNAQVDYAMHVEFGTREHIASGEFEGATIPAIPAQPFFYPGIRAATRKGQKVINRAARAALRSWHGD